MSISRQEFDELIKDLVLDTDKGETEQTHPDKISLAELSTCKDKVGYFTCEDKVSGQEGW